MQAVYRHGGNAYRKLQLRKSAPVASVPLLRVGYI